MQEKKKTDKIFTNLQEALKVKKEVTHLKLENLPATFTFPEEILELTNLKTLVLKGCSKLILPDSLANLKKLEKVYLDNCGVTEDIFEPLSELKKLHTLSLAINNIASIPAIISKFVKLQSLTIYSNQITNIPEEIGTLQKLKELDLSDNKIESLPSQLFELPKLTLLYLSSNLFTTLPEELGDLTNLIELTLVDSKISAFPERLSNLTKLKELKISDTNLTDFPPIGELKKLEVLEVVNCDLNSVPEDIGKLTKLQELSLSFNPISSLPASISKLKKLTNLELEECPFTEFPINLLDLENLEDVSGLEDFTEQGFWELIYDYCTEIEGPQFNRKVFLDLLLKRSNKLKDISALQLLKLMNAPNVTLRNNATHYLFTMYQVKKPQDLEKDSEVVVLGKTSFNKKELKETLTKHGVVYQTKATENTTHVVLTDYPKDYGNIEFGKVTLLTENDVTKFIESQESLFLLGGDNEKTKEHITKVRTLFRNSEPANVQLALQIIKTGGFPKALIDDVFIASKSCPDAKIRKAARKLLDVNVSTKLKEALKQRGGLMTAWRRESTAHRNIAKYSNGTELDGINIAWHIFDKHNLGMRYLWWAGSPEDIRKTIELTIEGTELNLAYKELGKIPNTLSEFKQITKLNLTSCDLEKFPNVLLLLPNLIELDLEGNEITKLPEQLTKLTKLERLMLNKNKVSDFPEVCMKMESLKYLKLSVYDDGKIANVPDANTLKEKGLRVEIEQLEYYEDSYE